ncbi:MAG: ATP-binding cassette domain-containing protein [Chitinophagales bacterium]
MFEITLTDVTKTFGEQQVIRSLSATFVQGSKYAITGANGSGKSTLLKILSGFMSPSSGSVVFTQAGTPVPVTELAPNVAISAPYLDLPEELTVMETIEFHNDLRPLEIEPSLLLEWLELDPAKQVRHASSGMKQRLKLLLACYTKADILILDEPTANLDLEWKVRYRNLLSQQSQKLVLIGSNDEEEYAGATDIIAL